MVKESIYCLFAQNMAFRTFEDRKGAIDVQDDYNRFIRRSMKQARCNYEDIFAADGTVSDMDMNYSCGCGMTMDDTDRNNSCGCMGTMGDTDMKNVCCKAKTPCGYGAVGGEQQAQMCCDKNVPVMVFIEMQPFGRMYNEAEALCRGTLFPALDKPFTGRGGCR